ncbi:hypothetical protein BELL_1007g00020 [Botrytis elliptica]|uniref:Uncharacterized protein n=1 Tax=Botrytis elliptica TaxID=278938 RepID=A0A4Z1IW07_9HELO|nr:hypothetical protein BELL_1007g00020 [Botrytis elliptica]
MYSSSFSVTLLFAYLAWLAGPVTAHGDKDHNHGYEQSYDAINSTGNWEYQKRVYLGPFFIPCEQYGNVVAMKDGSNYEFTVTCDDTNKYCTDGYYAYMSDTSRNSGTMNLCSAWFDITGTPAANLENINESEK